MFYPPPLADELVFQIKLKRPNVVVRRPYPTKLRYELTDVQLDYEAFYDKELAREVGSTYTNCKQFMYEHVHNYKTILVKKGSHTILNESINVSKRSLKRLLLLSAEPHAADGIFFQP